MEKQMFSLTRNEQEIMSILWSEDRPLSRSDIIKLSTERSWKASSIHILLNQLLEKEAIAVDGFVKTGKNYGRTFVPAFTEEEYYVKQFLNSDCYRQRGGKALLGFVNAFLNTEKLDDETVNDIKAALDNSL